MAGREDCIDEILKAAKGRMRRSEVEDHLEDIDARAQEHQDSGAGWGESYRRATEEMLKEQAVRSAILRRNLRMDALKFRDLRQFVDAAPTARIGIEARLVGVNRQFFDPKSRTGNQLSAAATALGAKKDWIGGAVLDMERAGRDDPSLVGLDRQFFSRALEREIFIERYELTLGDRGNPGKTKNAAALKIAGILEKWDRVRVEALNAEGAWITNYKGYVTRTEWDPDKLRKAAGGGFRKGFEQRDREVWASTMARHLDTRRTFGRDAPDAEKVLAEMYGGLVTGDHLELTSAIDAPIFPNVARRVSASRELHFKSAEDWLAANEKFGRFSPTDAWLYSMTKSAEHYALMKSFGSKPKELFEEVLAYAKNKTMGAPERIDLDKWDGALRNRFAVVSGEANRPVANMWSGIVNGVMAVQRMAKLGLTPFAMLQDNVTISRELARQGLSFLDRNGSIFSGYFQGAEGSAKREVAELLHTGILGRLQGVTARFDVGDARSGAMARMEHLFFKITGITAMTENKRADAERMMAYWMGKQRDKGFDELGGGETRTLQSFGIGEKEWSLLHKADWNKIEGATYLTPDVAHKLKDADVEAYLKERGTISERAANAAEQNVGMAPPSASAVERARQELALKLWAYYSERGQYSVLEVGPKERAILYQGTRPGQPLNLALRLLLQFKQFPTAMITKAWGAEIYGGASRMDKIAGLTELIVGSTLFGMMANYLNQTVKGQDPNAQWHSYPVQAVMAGFLRGGAASIYGDFLLGEWSRHGQQALETIAGPTISQVNQVAEIWADLTHMKKGAATAALGARMVRGNMPGMNMIYTKLGFDYLIYYRFMEWLNPGYLERMERTMKDKSGTEFWLRPSQVSR